MAQDNLTIEELLEIAESSDEPSYRPQKETDVHKYIKHFNIKAGTTKVPTMIIYHHYRKWRENEYMARRPFFKSFSKIFDAARYRNEPAYMLDAEPFDLSLESSLQARSFLRKEKNAKKESKS